MRTMRKIQREKNAKWAFEVFDKALYVKQNLERGNIFTLDLFPLYGTDYKHKEGL